MSDDADECRSSIDLLNELKRLAIRGLELEGEHLFGEQPLTAEELAEWDEVATRHNKLRAILIGRGYPHN
ncbi:hypothetical protein [Pseudomonas aeruginosa]|uniref:hypothetical protein n=1 Tax=Pseudomonas aeruginosa TaxID=287 RepID=UPI00070C78B9|nr:hypothetical protein [Pseudomonas aeruginosa]